MQVLLVHIYGCCYPGYRATSLPKLLRRPSSPHTAPNHPRSCATIPMQKNCPPATNTLNSRGRTSLRRTLAFQRPDLQSNLPLRRRYWCLPCLSLRPRKACLSLRRQLSSTQWRWWGWARIAQRDTWLTIPTTKTLFSEIQFQFRNHGACRLLLLLLRCGHRWW